MRTAVTERSSIDEIIDAYKPGVDFTLVEENLKLTPTQRLENLMAFMEFIEECQAAGRRARGQS